MKIWSKADRPELTEMVLGAIKEQGLSQTEVARRLGVSRQYFHRILRGKAVASSNLVRKIEEILQIDLGNFAD